MATTTLFNIPGYPAIHLAEDGTRISIRPMVPEDKDALLEFFRTIPERDRFYLKDDVTAPNVIEQWAENLDYTRVVPLLALHDKRIVAQGSLHRRRTPARRHVGEARIVVDPAYRDNGIGRGLLHKLAELANNQDMEKLLFEVVADTEEAARHAASILGFLPVAVLNSHVRDIEGTPHDVMIMEMNVQQEFPPLPSMF